MMRASGVWALFLVAAFAASTVAVAWEAKADRPAAEPVEPSMHEFMEYVFEPSFKRLKSAMATAPADNAGWKAIKGDSLSLAEAGNLLLLRKADEHDAEWAELSAQVRSLGGQLYTAARKKDYPTARKHYEAMVVKCNACHSKFAGGEHQLKP